MGLLRLRVDAGTRFWCAAAKRAKEGNSDALLVPTAIKYSYVEDISHTFSPCLDRLERQISWEPQRHLDIMDRIYKFGEAMLAVKEREWLGEPLSGDLVQRLQQFRIKLLEPLEVKYEFSHEGTVPQRIKRLKNKIRQILFDDEPTPEQIVEYRKDLKRLFTAKQLYTYPGQYLRERATQDRIAETIIKLEKDVLGKTAVRGRRNVAITFGDPVNMAGYLDAYAKDARQTVSEVTEQLERVIAGLLEPR